MKCSWDGKAKDLWYMLSLSQESTVKKVDIPPNMRTCVRSSKTLKVPYKKINYYFSPQVRHISASFFKKLSFQKDWHIVTLSLK